MKSLLIFTASIKNLTTRLEELELLDSLEFIDCPLPMLPATNKFEHLTTLCLNKGQLSNIGQIRGRRFMDISFNLLNEMPQIKEKEKVVHLALSGNPIRNIKSIDSFTNLESLFLRNMSLKSFPSEINKLKKLRMLDLSQNELSSLPNDLFNFHNIELLSVGSNNLSAKDIEKFQDEFKMAYPNAILMI